MPKVLTAKYMFLSIPINGASNYGKVSDLDIILPAKNSM